MWDLTFQICLFSPANTWLLIIIIIAWQTTNQIRNFLNLMITREIEKKQIKYLFQKICLDQKRIVQTLLTWPSGFHVQQLEQWHWPNFLQPIKSKTIDCNKLYPIIIRCVYQTRRYWVSQHSKRNNSLACKIFFYDLKKLNSQFQVVVMTWYLLN